MSPSWQEAALSGDVSPALVDGGQVDDGRARRHRVETVAETDRRPGSRIPKTSEAAHKRLASAIRCRLATWVTRALLLENAES